MRSPELELPQVDPEVLAEWRAREYPSRPDAGVDPSTWRPAPTVCDWPCRVPSCRVKCPVTQDAIEHLELFNRILVGRGETPIETDEVMICDAHKHMLKVQLATKRADGVERMKAAIVKLKQSRQPRTETDLIAEVTKLGHPDVPGLLEALEQKLTTGGAAKQRRRDT